MRQSHAPYFARSFGQFRDSFSRCCRVILTGCAISGEKTFSVCLCLSCCVSRVFSTNFSVAVSPCQQIGTSLSGRRCQATGPTHVQKAPSLRNMLTREAHWRCAGRGRLLKKRRSVPHCEEGPRPHTPEGRGEVTGWWVHPGINPHAAHGRREFKALQCALTGRETACESRVKTTNNNQHLPLTTNHQPPRPQPQPWHCSCTPTKSAMAKLKREVRCLLVFPQAEWVYSRLGVPKYLDVYGDSDWAGDEERKRWPLELPRSSNRRCVGNAIAGRVVWRGCKVLRLQPRDPRWVCIRATS